MSIVVVTGPPGAGKTTVSSALIRSRSRGVHLVADQVFRWIVSGYVPPWMPDAVGQNTTVVEVVAVAAARFAQGGYDVVVDGIVGPWFLPEFVRAIGPPPEPIHYVVLRPSRQVARKRAMRRAQPEDLVDPIPIDAMYNAFEDLGLFESHVIDSSDQDLTATVGAIEEHLDDGLFALTGRQESDMRRLATKFGIHSTDE